MAGAGRTARPRLDARNPRAVPWVLLPAARGDLEGASRELRRVHSESTPNDGSVPARPYTACAGATERRAKRRTDARATLQAALAGFERLGSPLWADKARAELGRIGGRSPSNGELTESERRVAARCGGEDEPGGRDGALPRRAHGGKPPDAHLREARRAFAHRARAPAALSKVRRSAVSLAAYSDAPLSGRPRSPERYNSQRCHAGRRTRVRPTGSRSSAASGQSTRFAGRAEVAVIGGGVTGCSCALTLRERGVRVRLHERATIAGGASGRNGGFALRGATVPYDVPATSSERSRRSS